MLIKIETNRPNKKNKKNKKIETIVHTIQTNKVCCHTFAHQQRYRPSASNKHVDNTSRGIDPVLVTNT